MGFEPSRGIITGGFPCQDLSVAGKRAGLAGARSGLFWEIARIVEETQTEYAISKMYLVSYPLTTEQTLLSYSGRWQTSGILSPGACLMLSTSEYPNGASVSSSLADVLLAEAPEKYYLSNKACDGILRRANRRGKTLPPALQEALVNQASPDTQKDQQL